MYRISWFGLLITIVGNMDLIMAQLDLKNLGLPEQELPVRVDLLPETAVGMCDNCEKNFPQNFFNEIISSKFAKSKGKELEISICKNVNLANLFSCGTLRSPEGNGNSNFPYVVHIYTLRKDSEKTSIVCQGVLLKDGSILTVFGCLHYTKCGEKLWIRCPGGDAREVKCMAGAKKCSTPFSPLSELYFVRLILESPCCWDLTTLCLPKIADKKSPPQSPIFGYLVVPNKGCSNCSYEVHSIYLKPAILVIDVDSLISLVFLEEVEDLCTGYQGALFIDKNGDVYGVAVYKPPVLTNVKSLSPFLKGLLQSTQCFFPLIPVDGYF